MRPLPYPTPAFACQDVTTIDVTPTRLFPPPKCCPHRCWYPLQKKVFPTRYISSHQFSSLYRCYPERNVTSPQKCYPLVLHSHSKVLGLFSQNLSSFVCQCQCWLERIISMSFLNIIFCSGECAFRRTRFPREISSFGDSCRFFNPWTLTRVAWA